MNFGTLLTRGRKALRMPPRQLAGRLRDELRAQVQRPWSRLYPHILSDAALYGSSGARTMDALWARQMTQPFFVQPAGREAVMAAFSPAFASEGRELITRADAVLRHEFDLLGSGAKELGATLPWLEDFKTGRCYPVQYGRDIQYMELDRPTDVKVPWELSRCQHFATLGQAYWLTGDERYAGEYAAEIGDWIDRNPFAYSVNWACPMDVALRAISWIWGFYFMAGSPACADPAFRRALLRSLFMHGEFISTHLETSDVNGNHYLSDGVGLVFLGLFFKHTAEGTRWLALGKRIVFDEILLQVSGDGVDFEQSTAYHRLVLELFLTSYLLLERHGEPVPGAQWSRITRMIEVVAAYTKPSGLAPLIGDADDGRVQKLGTQALNDHRYLIAIGAVRFSRADFKGSAGQLWGEAFWLLGADGVDRFRCLPEPTSAPASAAFPEGGLFVLRSRAAHLVVDGGEVGTRGRGGHGHNDVTSFELFLDGVNLVTDCGAYLYTASREWRNRFRSTAFHNVAQVDDEELNRFVGPDALWQLMDDAHPTDVRFDVAADADYLRAGHDGYARLTPPVWPVREFLVDHERAQVLIRDRLDGSGRRRVRWRFHFDPDIRAELFDHDCRLQAANREFWLLAIGSAAGTRRLERGWVSASYGTRRETDVLVVEDSVDLPIQMSHLFASSRLADDERRHAVAQLDARAARVH